MDDFRGQYRPCIRHLVYLASVTPPTKTWKSTLYHRNLTGKLSFGFGVMTDKVTVTAAEMYSH